MSKIKEMWHKKPLLISGPCSAETEEQVIQTAIQLKDVGIVDAMRVGIWKPRTRPGNFEGVGSIGLEWLKTAKEITGLPMAIEVASTDQVECGLKADIDFFWLGARTTANPFSVQQIADSLKGVKIPILIKNPINPDIQLWIGALERIQKSGIETIGLIHRGFSAYRETQYRNRPTWQLAIEMKSRFASLPFFIDPSHICGTRHLLKEVTQKAMDLDYGGVFIESHYRPDEAWSDAKQQITPEDLKKMLDKIIWRKGNDASEETSNLLEKNRRIIDYLDDEVLRLLGKRMKVAEEIGKLKKEKELTILQTERWHLTLSRLIEQAAPLKLSEDFIRQYFNSIHMESIKHQDQIMNYNEDN